MLPDTTLMFLIPVETGAIDDARQALSALATNISSMVAPGSRSALSKLVDEQMTKVNSSTSRSVQRDARPPS